MELDSDDNGAIDVSLGGTNAATPADARENLGCAPSTGHYLVDQAESELSAEVVVSADGKSLVTAADYAAMRVLLGVGSYIQAWDADLDTYATMTPSADVQSLLGAADYAAIKALLSIDDLVTLSGVADGAVNLGAFTGSTIGDDQTVKEALQALETGLETLVGPGDITKVLDTTTGDVDLLAQAATAFSDGDATPSVSEHSVFITANMSSTTISDFDDPTSGQIIFVIVNDSNTTFDFTSSGLEGTAADYLAANGEVLCFLYSAVDSQWHYLGFPKTISSVAISGGTAYQSAFWNASGILAVPDGTLQVQTYYDSTPATDDTWSGRKMDVTVGENVAQWDLLYAKNSSGNLRWYKYDANGADKARAPRAVALDAITSGNAGAAGIGDGIGRNNGWGMTTNQDEGKDVYASAATAGAITLTAPATSGDEVARIGYVLEENVVMFSLGNVTLVEVP